MRALDLDFDEHGSILTDLTQLTTEKESPRQIFPGGMMESQSFHRTPPVLVGRRRRCRRAKLWPYPIL